ncbi:MAG: tRNA (adenosine(37)-N6)-threonylcarbamoyltransferase complex ATPase subunit type 1 TsaE [Pseudomonadota bacterium]
MSISNHHSHNEEQTKKIAQDFSKNLNSNDIVLLSGPLGAGKSVFARALIHTLCDIQENVPSPTFTLVQQYESQLGNLWHFDLYRIEDPEEIYEIGWEDIAGQELSVVEWPERLGFLMPKRYIEVIIKPEKNDERLITIERIQ